MPRMPEAIDQKGCVRTNGRAVPPTVALADIDVAMGYIERHACDGLTPARVVAETQRVTLVTFQRHFLAVTGLTLQTAIRLRQLDEVRRLILRTELSPAFIAEHCGFRDLPSAARAFISAGSEVPQAFRSSSEKALPTKASRKSASRPAARMGES